MKKVFLKKKKAGTQESLRQICRCRRTLQKEQITLVIVVHVPRKLSPCTWYAIQEGVNVNNNTAYTCVNKPHSNSDNNETKYLIIR